MLLRIKSESDNSQIFQVRHQSFAESPMFTWTETAMAVEDFQTFKLQTQESASLYTLVSFVASALCVCCMDDWSTASAIGCQEANFY